MELLPCSRINNSNTFFNFLTGTKTFTIFAPVNTAFSHQTMESGMPIWTDNDGLESARQLILRHVIPMSLYTAGMRYYHQKESLQNQILLQIQKTGGNYRKSKFVSF